MTSPLTSFDLAQASGILLIDHVNFAVPYGAEGNRIAKLFYLEGRPNPELTLVKSRIVRYSKWGLWTRGRLGMLNTPLWD